VLRASGPPGGKAFDVDLPEAVIALSVEGRPYRSFRLSLNTTWDEHVVLIDAAALSAARTRLQLRGKYISFYYWFFQ